MTNFCGRNRRDLQSLASLARYLRRKPRTIEQIQFHAGVPWRTAYRMLAYLRDGGYDVVSRRNQADKRNYFSVLAKN